MAKHLFSWCAALRCQIQNDFSLYSFKHFHWNNTQDFTLFGLIRLQINYYLHTNKPLLLTFTIKIWVVYSKKGKPFFNNGGRGNSLLGW